MTLAFPAPARRARTLEIAAYVSLAVVFVLDAITPQALSIQITYEVSVVVAVLAGKRALVIRIVFLALVLDSFAALVDARQDGYLWDVVGVENRVISLLSIFLVGALALTIQQKSEQLGRSVERDARKRVDEAMLAATYRFWTALGPERIAKAVTEEAVAVFGATEAVWYPGDAISPVWARGAETSEATARERPPASPASLAAFDAVGARRLPATLPAGDTLRALIGSDAASPYYLTIPVADETCAYGVLFVATGDATPQEAASRAAHEYAQRALAAMHQTRLLEQLRHRNALLSGRQQVMEELVEAISHDVRTPLMALSVTLAQAQSGAYGALPAQYTNVLGESRNSIDGIQRLAETLLLVARFEAETPRDAPESVPLQDVVRETTSELSSLAEAGGLTLRVDVPADASVEATRSDVRRAISNLLANAIRNTPRGGTVELRARRNAAQIELAISDDGYGVDTFVRPSLFQRFSKASGEGGGTGLGLYIVRRVAEESGGNVRYEPRAPHGSVFTLSFPRSTQLAA